MLSRRLLPSEVRAFVGRSEQLPLIEAFCSRARAERMVHRLLVEDRIWAGVVLDETQRIIAFGSCVFVSDWLRDRVMSGHHRALAADLACSDELLTEVLTFPQVEAASRKLALNFYSLFTLLPVYEDAVQAGRAMAHLHESMVRTMSGFGLASHLKHVPGASLRHYSSSSYGNRVVYTDSLPLPDGTHYPFSLMAASRQDAAQLYSTPMYDILSGGQPRLALSRESRMLLMLELQSLSRREIERELLKGEGTTDSNWKTVLDAFRRDPEVCSLVGLDEPGRSNRSRVLDYVRQNPRELGALPFLTPREKAELLEELSRNGQLDWQ